MRRLTACVLALLFLTVASPASAVVWEGLGTDNLWTNLANWDTVAYPDGATTIANFSPTLSTANTVVDLAGNRTVGVLTFGLNSATNTWTLDAANTSTNVLTLNNGAGTPTITVSDAAVSATINSILGGAGFTKDGAGTLVLANAGNTFTGNVTVTAGVLSVAADLAMGNAANNLALGGGALQATASFATGRGLTLNAGANTIDVTTGTLTLNGVVDGANSFTKIGAGTLVLANAGNTFTGNVTVTAGVLSVAADLAMGNAANNLALGGGTLQATAGFSTTRGITLNAGTNTIDATTGTFTLSGVIDGTNGFTKAGAGTLELGGGSANTYAGTVTVDRGILLLSKTSGNAITGDLTVQPVSGSNNHPVVRWTASNQIADAANIVLGGVNGVGGGNLDLNAFSETIASLTINNNMGATGQTVQTGAGTLTVNGNITISGTSTGGNTLSGNLDLGGSVRSVDVTATGNATISALVTNGGIIKTGGSVLTLSNAGNTFAGGLTINGGTVAVPNDGALGASGNVITIAGGALRATANITTTRVLTLGAGTNAIDVTTAGQTFVVNGAIGGTNGFTKTGAGALTLGTTNSFVGTLGLAAGTVNVSADDQMGNAANTLSFTGGTLAITTTLSSPRAITLDAGTSVINVATGQTFTHSGVISGNGGLQKTGTKTTNFGTLELAGTAANTNTGLIDVRKALLLLNKTGVNAIGPGGLKISSTTDNSVEAQLAQSNQIDDAATVTLDASGTQAAVFNLNNLTETIGGLVVTTNTSGTGTDSATVKTGATGVLTVLGNITFNNNRANATDGGNSERLALITGSGSKATPATNGFLDLGGAVRTITVQTTFNTGGGPVKNDAVIETVIQNGGITKEGARILFLRAANTYELATTINAGTISITSGSALGDGSATNDLFINNGATLQATATADLGARDVTLGTLGATFDVTGTAVLTVPGIVSSSTMPSPLIKTGTGTLALTGVANTFTGEIDIRGGVLSYAADASLGNAGNAVLLGGTLNASEDLAFARSVTLNAGGGFSASANRTLTVNTLIGNGAGSALAISTTTNTGTVVLTQANTYTGPTTVTGGTVSIAAANNLGDGSATNTLTLVAGRLRVTETLDLGVNRTLTLGTGTNFLDVADTKTLTVSGVVGGTGSLTKEGLGTLVISAATSAITGQFRPMAGVTDVTAVPNIFQTGTLNLVAGDTGTINFGAVTALNLGGLIGVREFDYGTRTLTLGGNNTASTYTGALSGNGNVIKIGTSDQAFGGANSYTGETLVQGGRLVLRAPSTNVGNFKVTNNATLFINNSLASSAEVNSVFGAAANKIELDNGTLRADFGNDSDRTINREIVIGPNGGKIDVGSGEKLRNSLVLTGSGAVEKISSGYLILNNGSPTFTGPWTITGGIIENKVASMGDASATNTITTNGGTLSTTVSLAQNMILNGGGLHAQSGARTFSGTVNVTASSNIGLNDYYQDTGGNRNITFSGVVSGSANLTVRVNRSTFDDNDGTFFLTNAANDYSGTINVEKNLRLENISATGTGKTLGTAAVVLKAGHLRLLDNGTGSNQQLAYGTNVTVQASAGNGDLAGTNTIHVNSSSGTNTGNTFVLGTLAIGAQTLDVTGSNGYTAAFAGLTTMTGKPVINATTGNLALVGGINTSGTPTSFGLDKSGTGALVIGGTNYDSGPVNLTGGTLAFLEAGSIGGTGATITTAAGTTVAAAFPAGTGTEISQANFLDRIVTTSAGVIALGSTTTQDLDLSAYASARLGAVIAGATSGNVTFAPLPAGGVYRLGGGGGVLTLSKTNVLTGAMNLDIDNGGTAPGIVALTAANDFTGAISLKGGQLLRPQTNASLGNAANVINSDGGGIQFAAGAPFDIFQARTVDFGAGGFILDTNGNDYTPATTFGNGSTLGGLTKIGAGTLTLTAAAAPTYTPTTIVSGGTLAFADEAALGTSSGVTVNLGGKLSYTGVTATAAKAYVFNAGTVNVATAGTNWTIPTIVAGAGTDPLIVNGPGVLTLSGTANTFTAPIIIDAGTLAYTGQGNANPTALGAGVKTVTLQNGGVLRPLTASDPSSGSKSFVIGTGGGTFDVPTGVTFSLNDGSQLQGAANLTKTGAGTLVLGQATVGYAAYTGQILINAGQVNVYHASSLGDTLAGTTVAGGAALEVTGTATIAEPLTLSGTGIGANGALRTPGSAITATLSGPITLAADATILASSTSTMNLTNAVAITATNRNLTLTGAGTGNINGAVVLGTGGITKTSTGTWTLNGASSSTGAVNVNDGTLAVSGQGSAAAAAAVNVNKGTLTLNNDAGADVLTANLGDRLSNAAPVLLANGTTLQLVGVNSTATPQTSAETIGAVTFDGTPFLKSYSATPANTTTTLTAASLTRSGRAVLYIQGNTIGSLGTGDQVKVTAAPAVTNGMVAPYFLNAQTGEQSFLTYGANGFANAAYSANLLNASAATDIVDQGATAVALTGAANAWAVKLGTGAVTGGSLALGSGGLILNGNATHTTPITFGAAGAPVEAVVLVQTGVTAARLSGALTATAITKVGGGELQLGTGTGSFISLANSPLTIHAGTVSVMNFGTATNPTYSFGDTYIASGATLQTSNNNYSANLSIGTLTGAGTLKSGTNGTGVATTTITQAQDSTFTGTIAKFSRINVMKQGPGKLTLTNAASISDGIGATFGELVLSANAVQSGNLAHRGYVTVGQGGIFTLDNTGTNNTNRITVANGDDGTGGSFFRMSGGTFNFLGNASAASFEGIGHKTNTFGAPTFNPGANVFNIVAGAGQSAYVDLVQQYVRNAGASILIRGTNLGGTQGAANVATLRYGTVSGAAPTLVGASSGSLTGTQRGVLPGAIADSVIASVDTYGLATYDVGVDTTPGNGDDPGVRRLTAGEMAADITNGDTAILNNVYLTTASTPVTAATAINALHLGAGETTSGSIDGAGTLTINSGTILAAGGANGGIGTTAPGTLAFGSVEAVFYTVNNLTVGSIVTGSAGLTKGGPGTLTLTNAANTIIGGQGVTVNGGLVSVDADAKLGAAANVLRLNNGGGLQATGTFSIARTITLGNAGGVLDVTDSNRLTVTTATGGGDVVAVGAPDAVVLTKSGSGTLAVTAASTYTGVTAVNAGTLLANNTTGSATGTGAVRVNVGGTLGGTGTISGPVYINAGGTFNPGDGGTAIGNLKINNNLVFASTANAVFDIASAGVFDMVTGLTGVTYGGTLTVLGTVAAGDYQLFNMGGTGSFNGGINVPSGYTGTFNYSTGALSIASAGSPAQATVMITGPAAGTRVIKGQTLVGAVTGTVGNWSSATANLSVGLSSTGGLTVNTLLPASASVLPNASTTFSGDLVTGTATGAQTVKVTNTDGAAVPTTADSSPVTVYVLDNRTFTASSLGDLGLQHKGAAVNLSTTLTSGSGADDEATRVTISGGTDGDLTVAANLDKTFDGGLQTDVRAVTGNLNTVGAISGVITLSTAAAGTESATGLTSQTNMVTYSAQVYSGVGAWKSGVNGDWGTTGVNWSDSSGIAAAPSPGTTGGFDGTDTAAFDGVTGAGSVVSLNGVSPSLKSIAFSGTTTGYTVQPSGSGGSITMKATAGNASITASGDKSHTISAPVTAASNVNIGVTGDASLSLAGGLTNATGKIVTLSQAGTGNLGTQSIVNDGTLTVSASTATHPITVTAGIDGTGDTTVGTTGASPTVAELITEHIRQDVLTINAGSKVTISATGGSSSTSVVNVLNIANNSGTFNWSSFGGGITPAATGGPVASGAAVPEPATWLLAVMAALAGLFAWRRRK